MKQAHSIERFLAPSVSTFGSAGMILMFGHWLMIKKKKKDEQEATKPYSRQSSEQLWECYIAYRTIYKILMDHVMNGLFLTPLLMDSAKDYLNECQMYFQKAEPCMEKHTADAFAKLLQQHGQLMEGIAWELYEPLETNNVFIMLCNTIDAYEKKTIACLQSTRS